MAPRIINEKNNQLVFAHQNEASLTGVYKKRSSFLQFKKPLERTSHSLNVNLSKVLSHFTQQTNGEKHFLKQISQDILGTLEFKQKAPLTSGFEPTSDAQPHFSATSSNYTASIYSDRPTQCPVNVVKDFLDHFCNLGNYWKAFEKHGFVSDVDLQMLEESDLEFLGITSQNDRTLILKSAPRFLASEKIVLLKWLQVYQLQFLWEKLEKSGTNCIEQLVGVSKSKEQMEEFGLNTYALQKRLKACCKNMDTTSTRHHNQTDRSDRSEMSTGSEKEHTSQSQLSSQESQGKFRVSEKPVAVGYWAKPQALKGATSNFLCVQAALKAEPHQSSSAFQLEFMVDSGSDVVTCRPEILEKLGVKLLGKIESRGIHATVEKELYRGYLQLGGQSVAVEVMPESYESIGNQVMRHFKHYITNDRHFWLLQQQQS